MSTEGIIRVYGGAANGMWIQHHGKPADWEEAMDTAVSMADGGELKIPGLYPEGVAVRLEKDGPDRHAKAEVLREEIIPCSRVKGDLAKASEPESAATFTYEAPQKKESAGPDPLFDTSDW